MVEAQREEQERTQGRQRNGSNMLVVINFEVCGLFVVHMFWGGPAAVSLESVASGGPKMSK